MVVSTGLRRLGFVIELALGEGQQNNRRVTNEGTLIEAS